ncbi:citrate transporter [Corynebacterium suranareeae]|uniref:Citrate transporter n=1 Tax=Corynebacterium suranareeae TaxID=2506452 RepID=A0A160PNF1_9CORY|nr:CitMHS family transporter [Corynebacterium suranareeae]BAU94343.1 citrate transporter [Corynebacterium suranareeae]
MSSSTLLLASGQVTALAADYTLSHTPSDGILVVLGFAMILTFMTLIMLGRMTPMVAMLLVPTIFGLIAGAGLGLGDMALDAIKDMAPTAALLMFAIMFFGIMIDVGLFDPLIRGITRVLHDDPAKVVLGTAILAGVVSLDGDGSTTFIITTSAMLPIYLRLGMSPVVLTCTAGLINGTMNILPWGGPTVRAAAALGLEPADVFVPMVPSLIAGVVICLLFAWFLGLSERKRLGKIDSSRFGGPGLDAPESDSGSGSSSSKKGYPGLGGLGKGSGKGSGKDQNTPKPGPNGGGVIVEDREVETEQHINLNESTLAENMTDSLLDPHRATLRPKLFWFNAALTAVVMVLLVADIFPLAFVFMAGAGLALAVNFPKVKDQANEMLAHSSSIVGVVSMVLAAGVLVGVLNGTGMVDAMATWITTVIPNAMGPHLAVITGLLSIPMTFFMSNDAFYFGILPVLAESASHFGIEPVEMARASITGQPVHMQSPLVPAILLLVSLANVNLGDHHKKVLWRACIVSIAMLAVALFIGVVPLSA